MISLAQANVLRNNLSSSQYIGLAPDGGVRETTLAASGSHPASCPEPLNSVALNLRAICPLKWEFIDNGRGSKPRYTKSAICLCNKCAGSTTNTCQEERRSVPVLRRVRSENGLATYEREVHIVTVGCKCVRPAEPPVADHNLPYLQ
ncbi:interleukin-17 [Elysia marginata]|uniref:Interleukin-17 n=1 Tax=Elysia marginata TaxID=1093978 RepID=A0AAV4F597_9GAST|nr:interleukin-17 [Elysia marginata]